MLPTTGGDASFVVRHRRRCYQCWSLLQAAGDLATNGSYHCYQRPSRLLRTAVVITTGGYRGCYVRPSRLLCSCYERPSRLLPTAVDVATYSRRGCYEDGRCYWRPSRLLLPASPELQAAVAVATNRRVPLLQQHRGRTRGDFSRYFFLLLLQGVAT